MASRTQEMAPSLATSLALHVAVLAAALIVWRHPAPPIELPMASSVPVNIVPNAPNTDIRPAVQADTEIAAQAEDPDDAPPAIVAPRQEPHPAPPTPAPAPQPHPTHPTPPTTPQLAPTQRGNTQARRPPSERPDTPSDNFIQNLERSLAATPPPRTSGRPTTGGHRGPPRPPASPSPAPDAGDGFSVAEQNLLQQRLMELWNPNCNVANGIVRIDVTVRISRDGHLIGSPRAEGIDSPDLVVRVNAERAVRAFRQAETLGYLPVNLPDGDLLIHFDPRGVCNGGH